MTNKEKAKKVKPENREKKAYEYINKASKNQELAAKKLAATLEDFQTTLSDTIKNAPPESQASIALMANNINRLLANAKAGGNIKDIVKQLNNLK